MCADHRIHLVCLLHCKKSNLQELQSEYICVYFSLTDFFLAKTHAEKAHHFIVIIFVFDSDYVTNSVLNVKSFEFIYSLFSSSFLLLLLYLPAYSHLLLLSLCIFWCVVFLVWFLFINLSLHKFFSLLYFVFSHDFQISIIWKEIFNLIWLNQH